MYRRNGSEQGGRPRQKGTPYHRPQILSIASSGSFSNFHSLSTHPPGVEFFGAPKSMLIDSKLHRVDVKTRNPPGFTAGRTVR